MKKKSNPESAPEKVSEKVEEVKAAAAEHIESKPTRRWRARVFQIYLLLATVAFGALLVTASMFDYFPIDVLITRTVQMYTAAWFARLMWWVSFPGYTPQNYLLILSGVALLYTLGLRWEAVVATGTEIFTAGLGELIKVMVHRPRPGKDLVSVLLELTSYSFPSGHVLTYTVFFGFLFFLTYTLLKPSIGRLVLLVIWGLLVGLVGLSRIYLGNHWASDVTGAYLLGSLLLTLTIYVYRWGKPRFFAQQPLAPEDPKPVLSKG